MDDVTESAPVSRVANCLYAQAHDPLIAHNRPFLLAHG